MEGGLGGGAAHTQALPGKGGLLAFAMNHADLSQEVGAEGPGKPLSRGRHRLLSKGAALKGRSSHRAGAACLGPGRPRGLSGQQGGRWSPGQALRKPLRRVQDRLQVWKSDCLRLWTQERGGCFLGEAAAWGGPFRLLTWWPYGPDPGVAQHQHEVQSEQSRKREMHDVEVLLSH